MADRRSRRAQAPARSRWTTVGLAAVIGAAAIWSYATSFNGVFVLDDKPAIALNPNVRTLWPLARAMSAPAETPVSARPVASLSLAINYALADPAVRDVFDLPAPGAPPDIGSRFLSNVWGYHAMNLVLHILTALALFGVVRRTLLTETMRARFGAHATSLAFCVALLWVVHPLTTDAVTYVIQRIEILMGLFLLLTLYCSIRALEANSTLWTLLAIAACALGMASKQVMVVAPVVVWLWDWTFARATARRPLATGKPSRLSMARGGRPTAFYLGLAATWTILAALVWYERWPHSIGMDREGWTPFTYLWTQTGIILHYLRLAIAPWPLVLDYDGWPMARSVMDVWPQAIALLALCGLIAFGVWRRRAWAFAGAWVFLILAPSSSVLPLATEVAAERRMYLPLAAIVAFAVLGGFVLVERVLERSGADDRRRRAVRRLASAVLVGSVALLFAAMTRARNADFSSDIGLWADVVAKRPDNPRARVNYGVDLLRERRSQEAEQQLREAIRLKETSSAAHANLGSLLCSTGRVDEGIAHLERALAIEPDYPDASANLGEAYASRGRRADAVTQFALALAGRQDDVFLMNRLSWLLSTSPEDAIRDGAKAVELAERAIQLTRGQDGASFDTLAAAYAEVGRFDEAIAAASQAATAARATGNDGSASEIDARVKLYATKHPYREK